MFVKRPKKVSSSVVGPVSNCPFSQFVLRRNKEKPILLNQGVYVLQLTNGTYYIGKSNNITQRLEQHHKGEKKIAKRLTPFTEYMSDFESWERAETLHWMYTKGIKKVRGWMYVQAKLDKVTRKHAYQQICEKYDLCRKCGRKGHFIEECREKKRVHM